MPLPSNRDYTHCASKIDAFRKRAVQSLKQPLIYFSQFALILLFCSSGCSTIQRPENEKLKRRNCKGDYIDRTSQEQLFPIETPAHTPRSPYPWERPFARITKDFFRCRGDSSHPPLENPQDPKTPLLDCDGYNRHGLPVIHGKESVYPILLDLLNFIQERTGKKVVITCGHRCPKHNSYADPSKENLVSKHQIGAEVDFYVEGMENKPLEVLEHLFTFYKETALYQGKREFDTFHRFKGKGARASTSPWFNKEIFIQLFQPDEERDLDNAHPYPYLSIQVRFDRDTEEQVAYQWKKAHLGYPRG